MSSDMAILVENVAKCYEVYSRPSDRLKQMAATAFARVTGAERRRFHAEFWALRDISLEVARGECVALIGRNGSGKSTLLQVITGTVAPTAGQITVNGRVAALLELGSGFNPEFTGLENVYLNASLLGMEREEVEGKLDDILAFADIGEFVNQPVRTYSSGMVVRLAFAVQAQIDPEILIVDEALAVGDARFQAKCFARLKALREAGTSILLVTHSTEQVVTHCDRAVLLEAGRKLADGAPRLIVNKYLDLLYGRAPVDEPVVAVNDTKHVAHHAMPIQVELCDPDFALRKEPRFDSRPLYNPYEHRWGDRRAELLDFMLFIGEQVYPQVIRSGQVLTCYVRYRFKESIIGPIFGITLKTKEGVTVYGTNTELARLERPLASEPSEGVVRVTLPLNCAAGDYFLSLGIASRVTSGEVVPHDRRYDAIHLCVEADRPFFGVTDLGAEIRIV
ncbi:MULTISPECIES: ABC transporter ATP-binding protein [Pseudoxanthomonas]|uniref:Lipopolysaccharide transport system ATP-binding protein n=1 Tax=Pseudoxanthomonas winnipegensis TaxID=2480810 RepID=A0AAW8GH23_9GAMM|nr:MULTISPECIES: ABC transporter ATP-binding protein [Pseudoxanthomonas]MDQ1120319.1 lipopolysaccharide transport system ATP-binding protein [Pseudoxanthomonas winnipegensis]MDQ1133534.1 lipopolysaccharide transport system ATP-binding protein [Pseudoxanthomonas winnipegensis]MDR6140223.1 lipopolysaccharide transport system ATP-binding protein [Pseudoxanthomonas sp. SORGH_AS_0997]